MPRDFGMLRGKRWARHVGKPIEQVCYPRLQQPLHVPWYIAVNIADLATAIYQEPGVTYDVNKRVDLLSQALANGLPGSVQVLKLVDGRGITGYNGADIDIALVYFLRARRFSMLEVLDMSELRTPLCWKSDFKSTPRLAVNIGVRLFMPGEAVDERFKAQGPKEVVEDEPEIGGPVKTGSEAIARLLQ